MIRSGGTTPTNRPGFRSWLAGQLWKITGWTLIGEHPGTRNGILVGAPHTSNWDYIVMLAITWRLGITPKFLGKKSLFKGPIGVLSRATGGIPVDRDNPQSVVSEIVQRVGAGEEFFLVVAAEGTRKKGEFWKSGFYRIAQEAQMPITLGFVDRPSKTAGLGPTFSPSGNVADDMELVRAFYADKLGIHPKDRTEPRLRDETGTAEETGTGTSNPLS